MSLLGVVSLVYAAAGGGSAGYGGGGGGGFSGGGSGGTGAGGGSPWTLVVVIAIFAVILIVGAIGQARYRRRRRERVRRVELAAAEAADDDVLFAADAVTVAAAGLFRSIQAAWTADDRATLERLVGSDLLVEWRRRLDDFAAKGWRNVVEVVGDPVVEYVGLVNREADADDRVVVRVEAQLRDYVTGPGGRRILRNGEKSAATTLCEYWTLAKRDGQWTLQSIEQQAEGDHHLDGEIVASPWADTENLRAEAVAERAAAEAAPAGWSPAELADLDFDGDARAAALDLALADGRFDPDLIEASVRRAVAAWTEAVDGPDAPLEAVAAPDAVRELLHPRGERTRLVVRGAEVRRIRIAALDAAAEPPTVAVELEVHGRRYVEDRDTTAVLEGSQAAAATFTERWTLALGGPPEWPWRLAVAGAGTRA
jgi:predicted lipid-binding transport protein (Tim44 family)